MKKLGSGRYAVLGAVLTGLLLLGACSNGDSSSDSDGSTDTSAELSREQLVAGRARLTVDDVGSTWTESFGDPGAVQGYLDATPGCEAVAEVYSTASESQTVEVRPRVLTSPTKQMVSSGVTIYDSVADATAFMDGLALPATNVGPCLSTVLTAGGELSYTVSEEGAPTFGDEAYGVTFTPIGAPQATSSTLQRFLWVRSGRVVASFVFSSDPASPPDEAAFTAKVLDRLGTESN